MAKARRNKNSRAAGRQFGCQFNFKRYRGNERIVAVVETGTQRKKPDDSLQIGSV